jgi:hypothetical protein
MILTKVISGGQTGADQAGLAAARIYDIPTGGIAPKDFMTANGPMMQILKGTYGLEAMGTYQSRTWENVEQSDGTIRLCTNFNSPGEKCTLSAIVACRKPYIDIDLIKQPVCSKIATWIVTNNIKILNIAGNRERNTNPSIYILTFNYLCAVFGLLNKYT